MDGELETIRTMAGRTKLTVQIGVFGDRCSDKASDLSSCLPAVRAHAACLSTRAVSRRGCNVSFRPIVLKNSIGRRVVLYEVRTCTGCSLDE